MSNPPSHAAHPGDAAIEMLPAGAKDSHKPGQHGHTIVPLRLLVGVLVILLVFTVLTVSAANAEEWFSRTFDVEIPGWVNAVVALSIACVKSIIVAMYFMQLRYDHNPMNALVCVFTIMVATFFLGFIAIDLGNRGIIYQNKADQVIAGGIGGINRVLPGGKTEEIVPPGMSIAQHARDRADKSIEQDLKDGKPITNHAYLIRLYNVYHELEATPNLEPAKKELAERMKAYMERNEKEFEEVAAYVAAHSHGHAHAGGGHGSAANSANSSRTRTGVTLEELGASTGEHGAEHPAETTPAHEPAKDKPAAPAH